MTDTAPDPELRRKAAALLVDYNKADALHRSEAQLSLSQEAMKALLFVNGGAMVALFTLVGAVSSKGFPLHLRASLLWLAFAAFAVGLFATLVTYLLGFMSQAKFYEAAIAMMLNNQSVSLGSDPEHDLDAPINVGLRFWYAAIAAAVLAAVLFVAGAALALAGFLPA